jgi:hypothetical protein
MSGVQISPAVYTSFYDHASPIRPISLVTYPIKACNRADRLQEGVPTTHEMLSSRCCPTRLQVYIPNKGIGGPCLVSWPKLVRWLSLAFYALEAGVHVVEQECRHWVHN